MEASEEDEEALEVVSAAVAQDEEAVSAVVASAEDSAKTWRENFKQMCLSSPKKKSLHWIKFRFVTMFTKNYFFLTIFHMDKVKNY